MYRKLLCLTCLFSFGVASTQFAKASTITDDGATYALTYSGTSNANVFDVYLTVDTTGYNGGHNDYLNAVALQLVEDTSDISAVSLLSGPTYFGNSTTHKGQDLGSGGCNTSYNDGGFFCSDSGSHNGVPAGTSGDIYNFEWVLTVAAPRDLLTGLHAAQVEALYVKSNGREDDTTSDCITLTPGDPPSGVPEPSSLLLLGTGLTGLAGLVRRKRAA